MIGCNLWVYVIEGNNSAVLRIFIGIAHVLASDFIFQIGYAGKIFEVKKCEYTFRPMAIFFSSPISLSVMYAFLWNDDDDASKTMKRHDQIYNLLTMTKWVWTVRERKGKKSSNGRELVRRIELLNKERCIQVINFFFFFFWCVCTFL